MRLTIINIANKMPNWVQNSCEEYLKRINHGKYSCKIITIKAEKYHKNPLENMLLEAKKIKSKIPENSFIVLLDERGVELNSINFAKKLENIELNNQEIIFIIGGADGTHEELKKQVHLILRVSLFTFPHALVKIIILEQLYRAISILENHPYHRE